MAHYQPHRLHKTHLCKAKPAVGPLSGRSGRLQGIYFSEARSCVSDISLGHLMAIYRDCFQPFLSMVDAESRDSSITPEVAS